MVSVCLILSETAKLSEPFPKGLHCFILSSALNESFGSKLSPTLAMVSLFNFIHSSGYVVISLLNGILENILAWYQPLKCVEIFFMAEYIVNFG